MLSRTLPRPRLLIAGLLIVVAVLCIPIGKALIEKNDERGSIQTFTAALKVAAGGEAQTRCENLPFGIKPRSCLITYRRGNHAVSVSVDTDAHYVDGKMLAAGSRIRIDAT